MEFCFDVHGYGTPFAFIYPKPFQNLIELHSLTEVDDAPPPVPFHQHAEKKLDIPWIFDSETPLNGGIHALNLLCTSDKQNIINPGS